LLVRIIFSSDYGEIARSTLTTIKAIRTTSKEYATTAEAEKEKKREKREKPDYYGE